LRHFWEFRREKSSFLIERFYAAILSGAANTYPHLSLHFLPLHLVRYDVDEELLEKVCHRDSEGEVVMEVRTYLDGAEERISYLLLKPFVVRS
jgi:hypothetical protein